jgi:hypothetical protein
MQFRWQLPWLLLIRIRIRIEIVIVIVIMIMIVIEIMIVIVIMIMIMIVIVIEIVIMIVLMIVIMIVMLTGQGLDELELRAIYATLPEKFDNDAKGDKAGWCEAILQSIQAKCKRLPWSKADEDEGPDVEPSEEDIQSYFRGIPRNTTYR